MIPNARTVGAALVLSLAMSASGLGGMVSQVYAASIDVPSPAGPVTGAIVVFSPSILLLTPTPATGSLLVPVRVSPGMGSGPSFTQLQLVIPGPNPAQNTTVSLAQLLTTLLAQPPGTQLVTPAPALVSVFATSSK